VTDVELDPADPMVIRYRALVAQLHDGAALEGRVWLCRCGKPLPCPVVGLLLADLAQDGDRMTTQAQGPELL
jgi:hypothetical protein